jgi:signal transduction histidine kinase
MVRRLAERFGDPLMGVAFAIVAGIQIAADADLGVADRIGAAAVAVTVAIALAQRRRAPLVLAGLTMVSLLARPVIPTAGDGTAYGIAIIIAIYTCAAHLDARALRIGAVLAAGMPLYLMVTEGADFEGIVFASLLFGVPWVVGRMMRVSRQRQALLEEQAVLLERQRDEQARIAVADERQRIARELHDVVAHAISVVVLQARGGRRVIDTEPEAAREAFDAIESTSSQALGEMRRLLGLLRSDDDDTLLPQPSLTRIDELAADLRASGLPVEVALEGEPGVLPPGVDVSAYRIVQEALTNALKHAGPTRARVRIEYADDSVLVEVTDDGVGDGAVNGSRPPGSGHGLVGMRERVAIVGGELTAGPRSTGGYTVSARLPYAAER